MFEITHKTNIGIFLTGNKSILNINHLCCYVFLCGKHNVDNTNKMIRLSKQETYIQIHKKRNKV